MMATFLQILKVGLPIIAQLAGVLWSWYGIHQGAKAAAVGTYSISDQIVPVYGNTAGGATLFAGGLASMLLIHNRDKKKAADAPPETPAPGVDPVLHQMTIFQMQLAADPATTDQQLDAMNAQIKDWKAKWGNRK